MCGLEASEILLSAVKAQGFRSESEYFAKKYLQLESQTKSFPRLSSYVEKIECGPFGSSVSRREE